MQLRRTIEAQIKQHPRAMAAITIIAALAVYLLGLEWPLVIVLLVAIAALLPAPKVFNSWLGRIFVATFFLYALVQIAALIQLYTYPAGKFGLIASLVVLLTLGLIAVFGVTPAPRIPLLGRKDIGAAVICLFFVAPFIPILLGQDSLYRVAQIGGIQVVDSVVHYVSTVTYTDVQSLRQDYVVGRYYPSGFHLATSFVEHTVFGNVHNIGWKFNVAIYFSQYLVFGLLLGIALAYMSYAALEALGKSLDWPTVLSVALAVGIGGILLFLWAFIDLGFVNYDYVAAAVLVAACYMIESRWLYDPTKQFAGNRSRYTWPAFAFLLIGFGAAFSWPLLAPVVLLSAAAALLLPLTRTAFQKNLVSLGLALGLISLVGLLHLAAVYMQSLYSKDNNALVLLGGALQNFNLLALVVGAAAVAILIGMNIRDTAERIAILLLPYAILVAALMGMHFFLLGEARYYLIKCALLLDMFFLSFGVAGLSYGVRRLRLHAVIHLAAIPITTLFIILVTMGSVAHPFQEIRGLFREQSGSGLPPFYSHDTFEVTSLGAANQLRNYNMTILHYDAAGNRLFAHIEPALWANAMAPFDPNSVPQTPGTPPRSNCFGQQLAILAYGTNQPGEQDRLVSSVRECIANAVQHNTPYYIVTDGASLPVLEQSFGTTVRYVF